MCVSSCWEVAEAGRGDGVRRTSDLARREFGREWNFADEHMTSHSSFILGQMQTSMAPGSLDSCPRTQLAARAS